MFCKDGADGDCSGISVDRILHPFLVDVFNCFIAMVRDEVKEAVWGDENGTVVLTIVNSGFLFGGYMLILKD